MRGIARARYTLEFKQEAIRLVQGGQTVASAAKTLGLSGQTPHNWLKAEAAGRPREVAGKAISAEQMEIARLKAELAKARMERDILKKRRCISRESREIHRRFFRMSRSIRALASSAFRRAISICSALIALPATSRGRPAASAFNQLCGVWPESPKVLAADATVWPPWTRRMASCLN